jgi:hypothetical protein
MRLFAIAVNSSFIDKGSEPPAIFTKMLVVAAAAGFGPIPMNAVKMACDNFTTPCFGLMARFCKLVRRCGGLRLCTFAYSKLKYFGMFAFRVALRLSAGKFKYVSLSRVGNTQLLHTVLLPDTIKAFIDHALDAAMGPVRIAVPASLDVMGLYAFYSCGNLTTVKIGIPGRLRFRASRSTSVVS